MIRFDVSHNLMKLKISKQEAESCATTSASTSPARLRRRRRRFAIEFRVVCLRRRSSAAAMYSNNALPQKSPKSRHSYKLCMRFCLVAIVNFGRKRVSNMHQKHFSTNNATMDRCEPTRPQALESCTSRLENT